MTATGAATADTPAAATPDQVADVVIVGGGLAGLTLASALGSAGVPTVCIDRDPPAHQVAETFDIRTTAIAFGSKRILDGAGVWDALAPGAEPILDIRVADDFAPVFVHYDHRELGSDPLGFIVDNLVIRRGLFARIAEVPAVHHLAPATVSAMTADRTGAQVTLADGRRVRARLVVGADGRQSLIRQLAGIDTIGWAYDQAAIVCTIEHDRPHRGVAVEHFLPTGPFAVLPMTGNRSSIVWSEHKDRVPFYLGLADDDFAAEVRRRSGDYLGALRVVGPRGSYPLSFLYAEAHVAERVALIGEAAHAIHPIAGQGLNMGLRDVAALAEVVVDAWRLGQDVGLPDGLARYQRWRRFDNLSLSLVCDGLLRLFSNEIPPIRAARQAGLGIVNGIGGARRFFMQHAMGMVGTLPRLVRGEPL